MTLQFYLGTATTDHQTAMAEAAAAALAAGREVFYLVPNHVKFEAEVSLLQTLRAKTGSRSQFAVSGLQVLSFSRLAWYFLKDTPGYQQPRLDRASNTMLVSKVFQDLLSDPQTAAQLHLFAGSVHNAGFFAELADQLAELQTGRVTAALLKDAVARGESSLQDAEKLRELQVVAEAYEQRASGFATNAALLEQLTQWVLKHQGQMQHAAFFLDHFNDLSASEFHLVHTILHTGADLTVALTLDRVPQAVPEGPALFLPAAKLYYQLSHSVADLRPAPPVKTAWCRPLHGPASLVGGLDQFWQTEYGGAHSTQEPLAAAALAAVQGGLTIAKASEPYTELRAVARAIKHALHQDQTLRYRDFLIVARYLGPYEPYLQPVFDEQGLPVFIDRERPMQNHPLVALIQSLFAVQRHHYQYEDMMRLLKTELLIPSGVALADFRQALDVTDNFLLKTGKFGDAWLTAEPWQYIDHKQNDQFVVDEAKTAQVNLVRAFVKATLPALFAGWQQATTGTAGATVLYQWLKQSGVTTVLDQWRQAAIASGALTAATAGEQAWATLMTLLDDFAMIKGADAFDLQEFAEMLDAGFAGATYTQIPSTLDQITVSETGLSRLPKFRQVFVIGATSQVMPDTPADHPIITAADRAALQPLLGAGVYLPEAGAESALWDAFINYLAMMAGSDRLTLSYPVYADNENHASSYLTQLEAYFDVPETQWPGVDLTTPFPQAFSSARGMLADYMRIFAQAKASGTGVPAAWQQVLQVLRQAPAPLGPLAARMAAAAGTQNPIGSLTPALAEQLYSPHMNISISQLERYYANPFEYFLRYGLKLRKRPEFELTPADSGVLYHGVMEQLLREHPALGDLTEAKLSSLVAGLVRTAAAQPGFEILQADAYWQYVTQQIGTMLSQNALMIRRQQARTRFRPKETELVFGRDKRLAGLELPLSGGRQVTVSGRIDRLDEALVDEQPYFMVLDYKSSTHDFSMQDAYYGKSMQLLTYIDAVQKAAGPFAGMLPAGAEYFVFTLPRLNYQDQTKPNALLAKFQLKGLIILPDQAAPAHREKLIEAFDSALTPGQGAGSQSPVVELSLKKDGALAAAGRAKRIQQSQLGLLLAHNERLIAQAADQILSGVISLAPLQFKQEADVITRSDYQAIMRFDPATGGDHYHHVQPLTFTQVMQLIASEQEGKEND
ncbi:PD-(D/E)XK nuclease family protein [Lacticaseibacillus jixianensis]|uniref:PD-(D/E)XK nuclease family protein n=1 Tax=Lacticaseibacillus jixianensis TaxID=2486012 RepID=A0ABW4BAY6_9LACO|nr:PD-(D/E)XK nuclease family protein [Lacticaseibacillus jixianensis]